MTNLQSWTFSGPTLATKTKAWRGWGTLILVGKAALDDCGYGEDFFVDLVGFAGGEDFLGGC
jgi:hypothetical protein